MYTICYLLCLCPHKEQLLCTDSNDIFHFLWLNLLSSLFVSLMIVHHGCIWMINQWTHEDFLVQSLELLALSIQHMPDTQVQRYQQHSGNDYDQIAFIPTQYIRNKSVWYCVANWNQFEDTHLHSQSSFWWKLSSSSRQCTHSSHLLFLDWGWDFAGFRYTLRTFKLVLWGVFSHLHSPQQTVPLCDCKVSSLQNLSTMSYKPRTSQYVYLLFFWRTFDKLDLIQHRQTPLSFPNWLFLQRDALFKAICLTFGWHCTLRLSAEESNTKKWKHLDPNRPDSILAEEAHVYIRMTSYKTQVP